MSQHFIAGFFCAWSAIFIAAFGYCFWSARRSLREPGDLQLAFFCLSLAIFGGAATVFSLSDDQHQTVVAVATVASLATPALLFDFLATSGGKVDQRWSGAMYFVFGLLATAAGFTVLTKPPPVEESFATFTLVAPGSSTAVTMAGKVLTAVLIVFLTYREARMFVSARRGLGSFFGSVILSVCVIHDAAMASTAGSNVSLAAFGYEAFAIGLFTSQLARVQSRRARLIRKTHELSDRSQLLSRAFKELRAAQTELVRKEQLAAIGELSAVVAHEVRNPLAVIANAVAALRRDGVSADDRETLLKILEEETSRLNQLVGDLLHYAKPLSPESQLVGVRELIERALAPLRTRMDIAIDIVESEPVGRVGGDPMLLRQAIDNVVNNAVQAMPSGGTLTIVLERSGEHRAEHVTIAISDTGEGMDTVVRKRALDPFFTTRPAGTGLGLAIVARVVDAHGGQLTIRSAPGAGTEVGITLPVEQGEPGQARMRLSLTNVPGIRDSLTSIPDLGGIDETPAVPSSKVAQGEA